MSEHVNDLYEDMDRLNALYEELCWDHDARLDFIPDFTIDRLILNLSAIETKPLVSFGKQDPP